MKIIIAVFGLLLFASCNNSGNATNTTDSTTINTRTSSPADGGPNNGLGDTDTYSRMNDTTIHDTMPKK